MNIFYFTCATASSVVPSLLIFNIVYLDHIVREWKEATRGKLLRKGRGDFKGFCKQTLWCKKRRRKGESVLFLAFVGVY